MLTLEELQEHPDFRDECRALLEAWLRWRGDRLVPLREDIRPEDLGANLNRVSLIEVVNEEQIVVRLESSLARTISNESWKGVNILDATPPEDRKTRVKRYFEAMNTPCGTFTRQRTIYEGEIDLEAIGLLLPVTDAEGALPRYFLIALSPITKIFGHKEFVLKSNPTAHVFQYLDIGAGTPAE